MTPYKKAITKAIQLVNMHSDWLKLKTIKDKNELGGGQYDPQTKNICINNYKIKRKAYVGLIIHQLCHAFQDQQGYFQRKKNLLKGQQLQELIIKNQKQYVHGYHYKYVKHVLKMQYDREKRAYRLIKKYKDLRSFINPEWYINDANFYILSIKYKFVTGIRRAWKKKNVDKRPIIHDRIMNNRELLRPITEQQMQFLLNLSLKNKQ